MEETQKLPLWSYWTYEDEQRTQVWQIVPPGTGCINLPLHNHDIAVRLVESLTPLLENGHGNITQIGDTYHYWSGSMKVFDHMSWKPIEEADIPMWMLGNLP